MEHPRIRLKPKTRVILKDLPGSLDNKLTFEVQETGKI